MCLHGTLLSISKATTLQKMWHFPSMLPIMAQDQTFSIMTLRGRPGGDCVISAYHHL